MREQPDKSFDICITSPPYNMNLRTNSDNNGYTKRYVAHGVSSSTKYERYEDRLSMDEYEKLLSSFIEESCRVCELVFINIQQVTGNKKALYSAIGRNSHLIKECIIWDKINNNPAIQEDVMNSLFEYIFVFGENPITRKFSTANFDRGTLDNIWRVLPKKQDRNNKASYPLAIPEKILKNFSSPGMKAIDPFMGTGTTAIAAHYFGVDFVGIEIDEDYYKAAKERFDKETAQVALF